MTVYPEWLQITIEIIGSLIRLAGMLLAGLGFGWLVLEFFRKGQQAWQLQIAIFLGVAGLLIMMVHWSFPAALGGFGIGFGLAMLLWGLPKKPKEEKPEEK
jgi:membrane-bound ClpP family serine protease